MRIYMRTELRLHRHLWHFQTLQCFIFFINITYYFHILHLVQCTFGEKKEITDLNIHSGFIKTFGQKTNIPKSPVML